MPLFKDSPVSGIPIERESSGKGTVYRGNLIPFHRCMVEHEEDRRCQRELGYLDV
jgi:hypothetical protein